MATTATPAQKPTPWDKKTERLEAAIARVDGEIAVVNARYAEKISQHNEAVETCERVAASALLDEESRALALRHARGLIEQLERRLAAAREAAVEAEIVHVEAQTEHLEAQTRAIRARTARAVALDEPNRHLAALEHDKKRLQARLDLHRARAPRSALFG